ncbi:helicase [Cyanobium sp. Morenito 9A2]|uniref:helicase n=1 Tax=Cyanobium sp. Morenito 9A2 TaxID=2823718 RepID=UPI0020CBE0AC|nr:helicase [Cyanobium sp. Morenito 9A2]MCP9850613.1 helicase [Cyanobium sp. Morenito 9A2]
MLEARAHHQLKALLRQEGAARWPHHLTLSRLVARSLRRGDQTFVRLSAGRDPSWLVGLLVPLALSEAPVALVLSAALRQRLLHQELPRLKAVGLNLPCWEGEAAPAAARLWLLSPAELVTAWRRDELGERQLVLPEAEGLERALRQALGVVLETSHWEMLRRSLPAAEASLLALHERLSRRIFSHPSNPALQVALRPEEEAPLAQLLQLLDPLPDPWPRWLESQSPDWTGWATVDPQLLQWTLHRQPLEPLEVMAGLLRGRGTVLIGSELGVPGGSPWSAMAKKALGFDPQVTVRLSDPPLQDPLPIHAPQRQALPNSPDFGQHLLEHSRRLVLGQEGLTVVLIDDGPLRLDLISALAAEFGSRVDHQTTAPESNGVLCCSWDWWLAHQERLPLPGQIVVALLPIASLEDPLTAARVWALRQRGRDWFRELLLPEALSRMQRAVAGLRRSGGRLALLDGRVRRRSWGRQVLEALEPWVDLPRLMPR